MAQTQFRSRRAHRATFIALCASAAFLPGVAFAQATNSCVLNSGTVTCTGAASSFANPGPNTPPITVVNVSAVGSTAATLTGQLQINTTSNTPATLNNGGTITGSSTGSGATVWFGSGTSGTPTVINNGSSTLTTATITSTNSSGPAIKLGDYGIVNNYGTLTAVTGTPVAQFGAYGIFNNTSYAPAAVSGNIVFSGTNGTFNNFNTTAGFNGAVTSISTTTIANNGVWAGALSQTAQGGGVVTFTNGVTVASPTDTTTNAGVTFTGYISTGDKTILTNNQNAAMTLVTSGTTTSSLGQSILAGTSQFTNYGTLSIGTGYAPSMLTIDGSFTQGANATLNMIVLSSGGAAGTAGTNFSQIVASKGSIVLNGGTLALNIAPGYYTTTGAGSTYNLLLTDGTITGNFTKITGTSGVSLPFLNFVPTGGVLGSNYTETTETITTTTTTTAATSTTAASTVTTTAETPGATVGTTTTTTGGVTKTVTVTTTGVINPTNPSTNTIGHVTVGTQQAYQFTVTRTKTYAKALTDAGIGTPASVVTSNQLSIATGLQPTLGNGIVLDAANAPTTDAATFTGEIDVLTIAQAQAFLDSVSPEGYLAYRNALHDQANAFTRTVALRMDDQNSAHDEDGWWFSTQGEYELISNSDSTKGYRSRDNLIGFVGGYDFSGPHHVYGLAMNLSWDALTYAPGTMKGHNRDLAFDAYGAYDFGPLRLSGQLAYNMGHLGANKTIDLGSVTRAAHGSAGEHLLKATGTVSLNVEIADYKLTPFASIEYANGKVSGFTETSAAGTTASDLTVSAMSANRTDVLAGFSFTRSVGMFRPYIRAAYRNQLGSGSSNTISAYFNGDTATTFNVTGVAEARHELDTNAGVNWVFDDAGTLFVGYQGTMRSGHRSVGLNFGIRLEF